MAIFKVPRITTAQRTGLTLEASEIVYDTDQNRFYGGDGSTLGGAQIGGGFSSFETFTLTSTDILNKQITLSQSPVFPQGVQLLPSGGIPQRYGIDFVVTGNILDWSGLGLDNFVESGDVLFITY